MAHADLVIEWSPRGVRTFDGRTQGYGSDLANFRGRDAILALGRRSVFVRWTRLPNVSGRDLEAVLRLKLAELFPVPPDGLAFAALPSDDVTEAGRQTMVVAAPTNELRSALAQLQAAGIRVVRIVPAALGSVELPGTPNPTAIVHQVPDGFAVDVVDEGRLVSSRVVAPDGDLSADVCLAFTVAGLPCGESIGAAGLQVQGVDRPVPDDALAGILRRTPAINLELPETLEARRKETHARRKRQALLLGAATFALAAYLYNDWDERSAAAAQAASQDAGRLRRLNAVKKSVETEAGALAGVQTTLDRAFRPGQKLSDVVELAAARLPEGAWLSGVSIERGKDVQIRGVARNSAQVSDYVRALENQPRLRDVRLVFANDATIEDAKVVQFSVSAFPVGNLPLTDSTAKAAVTRPGGTSR